MLSFSAKDMIEFSLPAFLASSTCEPVNPLFGSIVMVTFKLLLAKDSNKVVKASVVSDCDFIVFC